MAEEAGAKGEELNILVNLSGRGDKDLDYVQRILGDKLFTDPCADPVLASDVPATLIEKAARA